MSQPLGPSASESSPLVSSDVVRQLQIASFVIAGATAVRGPQPPSIFSPPTDPLVAQVVIWDILHSLADDYQLFFKHRFQSSAAAYIVSRIASLNYVLGFTIFASMGLTAQFCFRRHSRFDSFYPISFGSSSLLFLFRVRAVFGGHRFATWAFGILWISTLAASITIPIGSTATKIGSACIVTQLSEYVGVHAIAMTLYDTSVFLAISYRLLANSHVEQTPGDMITALFRGANLPAFSNALFRDGQKYYLIAILGNALMISMLYAPGISPIYRGMLAIPNIALTNIVACRVYRNARLHYVHMPNLSLPVINTSGMGRFSVRLTADQPYCAWNFRTRGLRETSRNRLLTTLAFCFPSLIQ
ncbi:hypothetical protein B0H13DRAFT_2476527 [Mycena leptocephala]|nr:hypothetical protein B0H13DRAFT_2476527 [Mycena leptocephala]